MNQKDIYRHEIKYLVTSLQAQMLESRISHFAHTDPNAGKEGYQIRSLYFDDMLETAYFEKYNGVDNRKKWRIRIYNYNMSTIKLECKRKTGSGIYKESTNISEQQYMKILQARDLDFLRSGGALLQKFYEEIVCNLLRPKIIVDYERIPYVYDYGNVRITFDKNIRAGIGSYLVADKEVPTISVFSRGEVVLEVKYTEYIPAIFQDILSHETENEIAVSKYVMCCDKMKELYE